MKKALTAWLLLLVMVFSAVGFAEEYDPSMFGEAYQISNGAWVYKNEFFGFLFANYSEDWQITLANRVSDGFMGAKATQQSGKYTYLWQVTYATKAEEEETKNTLLKGYPEGTITFLGKDQPAYILKDEPENYAVSFFLEKGDHVFLIGIVCTADALDDILASFISIQDATERELTPMETPAAENIPNILGTWKDSAGNSVYSNDYFGFDLTISNSSWTYYSVESLISQFGYTVKDFNDRLYMGRLNFANNKLNFPISK